MDRSILVVDDDPAFRELAGRFLADLGLRVTAEGIEHTDQLQALAELGCEYGQGFHFSRPLPAGDIAAMLAAPTALM